MSKKKKKKKMKENVIYRVYRAHERDERSIGDRETPFSLRLMFFIIFGSSEADTKMGDFAKPNLT